MCVIPTDLSAWLLIACRDLTNTWFVETAAILRDEYFAERYPSWSGQVSPSRAEAEQYCEAVARVFAQLFPET